MFKMYEEIKEKVETIKTIRGKLGYDFPQIGDVLIYTSLFNDKKESYGLVVESNTEIGKIVIQVQTEFPCVSLVDGQLSLKKEDPIYPKEDIWIGNKTKSKYLKRIDDISILDNSHTLNNLFFIDEDIAFELNNKTWEYCEHRSLSQRFYEQCLQKSVESELEEILKSQPTCELDVEKLFNRFNIMDQDNFKISSSDNVIEVNLFDRYNLCFDIDDLYWLEVIDLLAE
ncbi:MAG: hypothetical protein N4A40_13110 [Tissierellales bacterium]|jgi:hypothetical protein|nr:hypothetical protein [Tissierellales bacterium]